MHGNQATSWHFLPYSTTLKSKRYPATGFLTTLSLRPDSRDSAYNVIAFHNGRFFTCYQNPGSRVGSHHQYNRTENIVLKILGYVVAFLLLFSPVQAKHNSEHALSAEDWKEVMGKVALLEGSGLMPMLLPVIMGNRDALQLTDEQVSSFRSWRKKNYTNMVNTMNKIIELKVQFRVESLSPNVSSDSLIAFQSEIQELQRQLLKIKLTCREQVMATFTDEQWDNFAFIVSDNPKLASLMPQAQAIHNGSYPQVTEH